MRGSMEQVGAGRRVIPFPLNLNPRLGLQQEGRKLDSWMDLLAAYRESRPDSERGHP